MMYVINASIMILSFFSCRIAWGWWLSLQFFASARREWHKPPSERPPLYVIILFSCVCVTLNCLNMYWFSKMVQKANDFFVHKKEIHSDKDE